MLTLNDAWDVVDGDVSSGTRAWVVNEEFARLYLPAEPLGYRFVIE